MPINFTAVLQILPQFIAAGIISFIFYAEFKKPRYHKPNFILVRENDPVDENRIVNDNMRPATIYEPDQSNTGLLNSQFGNAHIFFLTVNLWILLAFVLIPFSSLGRMMPSFAYPVRELVYLVLAIVFVTAVASTVISRISMTRSKLIILLLSAGVGAYMIFYLPIMQWASDYTIILRWVIIYCTVAVSLFGIYTLSYMLKKRQTTNIAVVGSYAAYFMTAALLTLNVFQNAL